MAIVFDAASGFASKETNTLTWSHTCAGTERMLLVFSGSNNAGGAGTPVSSVTYAGAALTLLWATADPSQGARTEVWYLVSPPAGTANVVVTYAGNPKFLAAGSQSFTGVDQTTPIEAHGGVGGTGSPITAYLIPLTDGAMVADGAHFWNATTVTPGAGQTLAFNVSDTDGREAGSYKVGPTAGQSSTSWTHNGSSAAVWAVALKPAAVAGAVSGAGTVDLTVPVSGTGGVAGPPAVAGSGSVQTTSDVSGVGATAPPGSSGPGNVVLAVDAAGSGAAIPPLGVIGSGGVSASTSVFGGGSTVPPGVNGGGMVVIACGPSGSGATGAPPGAAGSGGTGLGVDVAGTGSTVPPGVSGTGTAGLQSASAGVGTVVTPPEVSGVGTIPAIAEVGGSGLFAPAGTSGPGTLAVRMRPSGIGTAIAPTTITGSGTAAATLQSIGQGVVFAGQPEPTIAVVIREGPGGVVLGPEVDTVEIQDEPTTVTVG